MFGENGGPIYFAYTLPDTSHHVTEYTVSSFLYIIATLLNPGILELLWA